MIPHRRRSAQRGQAMVETAVVVAVLLTLLTGVYSVSQFASDQNTAGTATRAGARLAAELGNNNYKSTASPAGCQKLTAADPCAVDVQVVQVVCQISANMPFVTKILEIDIYRPIAAGDGSSGDQIDRYTSCTPGRTAEAGWGYGLDLRKQVHPNESYIGVSVTYQYTSPTPIISLTASPTVYTVMQMSPKFT